MFFFKKEKDNLFFAVAVVLLSIISGVIGGIFIQNFFSGESASLAYIPQRVVWRSPAEDVKRLTVQVAPMIVKLYRRAPNIGALAADPKNSFFADDFAGLALAITADGWLITADRGLDYKNMSALAYDHGVYKIQKIFKDNYSKLVFLKTGAANLVPARFGDSRDLSSGDYLFFPDEDANLVITGLVSNYFYSDARAALIRSSDKLNRLLALKDKFSDDLAGAPVFNIRGEAIGIFADNNNKAIPLESITPVISSFLKNNKVSRPALGVYYANLSLLKNSPLWQKLGVTNGAMIFRGGEVPFAAGSAARAAGLREGDIIVKIEREALNAKRDLAEVISEYEIGTTVNLGIIRNSAEMTIPVTLK